MLHYNNDYMAEMVSTLTSNEIQTYSTRQIWTTGHVVEVLTLHLFLVSLEMVEVVKVRDDDRHRKGDGEHTSDGAQ